MDIYKAIHDNIVNSRKHLKEEWKPVGSGLERHRIVPGHMGGEYVDSNCTYLTAREHKIVHYLLWKLYGNAGDKLAVNGMKGGWVFDRTGIAHTEETKKKLSRANKGRVLGPMPESQRQALIKARTGHICKPFTEEHKKNMSGAMKGRKLSEEHRENLRKAQTGKKLSEEAKRKIGAAASARQGIPTEMNGVVYPSRKAADEALKAGNV